MDRFLCNIKRYERSGRKDRKKRSKAYLNFRGKQVHHTGTPGKGNAFL